MNRSRTLALTPSLQHFRSTTLACAISHALMSAAVGLPLSMLVSNVYAQEVAVKNYKVPAGSLTVALNRFGRDAGIMLSFSTEVTNKLHSNGLSGSYTVPAGLHTLLAGSGLEAVRQANGGYTLQASTQAPQQDAVLAPVTVNAQADATTEGTGSYTTRATGAATRMNLSLRETPQSVSVIGRQQMDDQNLVTLTDVLRQTPGIVADRLDERVNFSSRGFDLSTMIDGVPTLSFDTVAGARNMISTAIYDRVEVIRGAAGLLNGSGSPGGAINLVRKRPGNDFAGHVGVGVGSWNRYSMEADLGGRLNEAGTLRGRVVASHSDGDSFIDAKKQREDVFYGIIEADIAPSTVLAAGYEYQKTAIKGANFGQSPLFYNGGIRTDLPRSFNSSTPWSIWDMTTERLFVNLQHRLDNGWQIKADAAYTKNKRDRYSGDLWLYPANINSVAQIGSVQVANNPADATNKSLDVYASGPFQFMGRTHQAMLGMNINKYSYEYSNSSPIQNAFYRPTVNIHDLGAIAKPDFLYPLNQFTGETEQKALYGAMQLKPLDTLSVLIGGRLSSYENRSWQRFWTNGTNGALVTVKPVQENSVFTPFAGVVLDVSQDYSVYASYTDIFQPNTVRDTSNNVLDPRRGSNLELGIKGEHFGGKLNTALAIFETQEDNVAVTTGTLLPDGTPAYRAAKGARSKGYELSVSGELARGWQLMGGYTYSAKRDNKDVLLNPTYPRRLFRMSTSYRLPGEWSKLTIGGNLSYQSDIYYDESNGLGRATQGGLTLLGLMARYDFSKQLSVLLNVENLTDKYYYTGLGGYNGYTYGNPRNAWLKLNYKF